MSGGRLALRWQPVARWSVELAGAAQFSHVADSQYVTNAHSLTRSGILPEPHDNDFSTLHLTASGPLGGADFLYSGSITWHEIDTQMDATAAAALFGRTGPTRFEDTHHYRVMNHELRLSGSGGAWRWLLGASLLDATTEIDGALVGPNEADQSVGALDEHAREVALYGEAGWAFAPRWRLDAGLRAFHSTVRDELAVTLPGGVEEDKRSGISPSLSLSFAPDAASYYYIRAASAFRPRGLSAFAPVPAEGLSSDELNSISAGARWHDAAERWSLRIEAYASQWFDMQSDYVLPTGLIATRNSGNALIYGVELDGTWAPTPDWSVAAGFDAQHAKAEVAGAADNALPVVPQYKGHASVAHRFALAHLPLEATLRANLTGPAHVTIYSGVVGNMPTRLMVDGALSTRLGGWRIGLGVQNLLNSRADSFAYGNPFSIRNAAQHTPPRPRTISLTVSWRLGD